MKRREMLRWKRITKPLCILSVLYVSLVFCNSTWAVPTGWSFVVDAGDPGYSETGKAWVTYTFPDAHNGEYRYLSHLGHTVERKGTASWEVNIPTTGKYQVDIHFRPTENRSSDADFHVYDGKGNIHKYSIDQTYHGVLSSAGWHTLGVYSWNAGQAGKVVLDGTDDDLSDEADAIRWILLEKGPGAIPDVPFGAIKTLLLSDGVSESYVTDGVNLVGDWLETGGYEHCDDSISTNLLTNIVYTGSSYTVNKTGVLVESDCSFNLLYNWEKTLSATGEMINSSEFTAMMAEIFSPAIVSILSFSTDKIVYQIDHPTDGIQTLTLKRNI